MTHPEFGDRNDSTREAIAVLTAWASVTDDNSFSIEQVMEVANQDEYGVSRLVTGLINLNATLLGVVRNATGMPPLETLQKLAEELNTK